MKMVDTGWVLAEDLPSRTVGAIEHGRYKEVELAAAALAFRPDDCVLDAGGGVGYVAWHLLERGLGVVSVEPLKEHYQCLVRNCTEHARRHMTIPGALGLTEGHVNLWPGPNGWDSSTERDTGRTPRRVRQHAVDALVEDLDVTALCLDMEGAELRLLHGMDLRPIHAVVAELHGTLHAAQEVQWRMIQAGFRPLLWAEKPWEQTTWVGAWRR